MKKRHGWLLGITLFIWLLIVLMVIFVDPENVKSLGYFLPGLLVYLGLFFLLSILTMSSKRALLWASVLTAALYLRLWGLGSYLNLLLLLGVAGSVEAYAIIQKEN